MKHHAASATVLALLVGIAGVARAQPAAVPAASAPPPASSEAPTPAPPTESPAGPAKAGGPTIATPAETAPPAKVEKAKDVAKAAALTPILPSPQDPTRPAFQLYSEVDLPLVGIGAVIAAARFFRSQQVYCAPLCDRAGLNVVDRSTAGRWNPTWSTASDLGLYGIIAGATTLLVADEGVLETLNDGVVIAEAALSATAVSSMLTLAAGRPRPYMYGTNAPLSARTSADAGLSFLSSHASVSFAVATSTYIAMHRIHPTSHLPLIVLGVGEGAATFVAVARVAAGKHFITDALGGAIVGSSVGVLVASLHGSPVRIVPVVSETEHGLGFSGAF